jgi:hypothetical protein
MSSTSRARDPHEDLAAAELRTNERAGCQSIGRRMHAAAACAVRERARCDGFLWSLGAATTTGRLLADDRARPDPSDPVTLMAFRIQITGGGLTARTRHLLRPSSSILPESGARGLEQTHAIPRARPLADGILDQQPAGMLAEPVHLTATGCDENL